MVTTCRPIRIVQPRAADPDPAQALTGHDDVLAEALGVLGQTERFFERWRAGAIDRHSADLLLHDVRAALRTGDGQRARAWPLMARLIP